MITKDQIEAGCDLWVAGCGEVFFSAINGYDMSVRLMSAIGDSDYFTTKEEAEEEVLRRALLELNRLDL